MVGSFNNEDGEWQLEDLEL